MGMGWIGGVIAANYACMDKSKPSYIPKGSGYDDIKNIEDYINQMMEEDGCETLEDKLDFLYKLQRYNFDFSNKEFKKNYHIALENLFNKIKFQIQYEEKRKIEESDKIFFDKYLIK